jgi:hypothetical protein
MQENFVKRLLYRVCNLEDALFRRQGIVYSLSVPDAGGLKSFIEWGLLDSVALLLSAFNGQ